MYRFYVEKSEIREGEIRLTGEDNNHIRNVLRMQPGQEITVCDGEGTDYLCRLKELGREQVTAEPLSKKPSQTELPVRLILYQGLPKKDKLELIIQKAVELGASEIVPVVTKRTIVRLEDERKEARKRERWQSIARSAAMQSMRGILPQVSPVLAFSEALREAAGLDGAVIPYECAEGIENTRRIISGLQEKRPRSVGIFIGPEGGFEEEEIAQAEQAGVRPVTLGRRILRTETAGLAMLSILMLAFEEDGSVG
ncbi:MAG: 16S rRNA (uracil(1498)-N(3))-methyltransferase [Lachnospiraceae bacterium]|nr:16S rRNA (uracil(1498)-N(3))-methyltransferase [Lachnospiraceae bacterium]